MAAAVTAFIYGIMSAVPPAVLFWGGWLAMFAGAAYFAAGLKTDNHRRGKKYCRFGVLYALAGALLAAFPDDPVLAAAMIFMIVLIALWSFFGFVLGSAVAWW